MKRNSKQSKKARTTTESSHKHANGGSDFVMLAALPIDPAEKLQNGMIFGRPKTEGLSVSRLDPEHVQIFDSRKMNKVLQPWTIYNQGHEQSHNQNFSNILDTKYHNVTAFEKHGLLDRISLYALGSFLRGLMLLCFLGVLIATCCCAFFAKNSLKKRSQKNTGNRNPNPTVANVFPMNVGYHRYPQITEGETVGAGDLDFESFENFEPPIVLFGPQSRWMHFLQWFRLFIC